MAQARGSQAVASFRVPGRPTPRRHPGDEKILATLAEAQLAPLAAHDTAHGTDLLVSLRAFLEHHGQWEAAFTALGVHRHTLRSRIERVRGLLGADLDSAHVRAELVLASSAWQEPGGSDRTG
ncbi:helix-turn-helix domain-containing protein [Streptomyces sp. NPDC088921]|uniref:helix-turn-helix domain-containing protein n=1 Tax=unclassified Streptomyces TaxID=2593676 RepID=UPI00342331E0